MSFLNKTPSRITGGSVRSLTQLPETLERHGIKPTPGITAATQAHAETIAHIKTISAGLQAGDAQQQAIAALGNGTATVEQVATAITVQTLITSDPASPYRRIIGQAETNAARKLRDDYAKHADEWFTSLKTNIESAANRIIEATQYAPIYDAFHEPNSADHWLSNPEINNAWNTYGDLVGTARTLRLYGILPGIEHDNALHEWEGDGEHHEQRAGQHLTASIRDNMRDGKLTWFLMAVQHGMKPTLNTNEEAAQQATADAN